MKALGFRRALPIDEPESLIDFDAVKPTPESRDVPCSTRQITMRDGWSLSQTSPPASSASITS